MFALLLSLLLWQASKIVNAPKENSYRNFVQFFSLFLRIERACIFIIITIIRWASRIICSISSRFTLTVQISVYMIALISGSLKYEVDEISTIYIYIGVNVKDLFAKQNFMSLAYYRKGYHSPSSSYCRHHPYLH